MGLFDRFFKQEEKPTEKEEAPKETKAAEPKVDAVKVEVPTTEDNTEAEASKVIDSINYFKSQKEVLFQKLNYTLKTKLTAKQVLRIHIAEEKFHRKMVHGSRNKKNIP